MRSLSLLHAMGGVFSIFLVVGVGFLATKLGHLTLDFETKLSVISAKYAIPSLIFANTVGELTPTFIKERLGLYMLLPAAVILLGYGIARIIAIVAHLPPEEHGTMGVLFSMSNIIFIGIPVCLAVFGAWTTPFLMSYIPSNTLLFWTIGNIGMMPRKQLSGKQIVKNMFSPPLVAFIVALLVVFLKIPIPDPLLSATKMLGGLATPATLLIVGSILARMNPKLWQMPKMVKLALVGRLGVMPALMFLACRLLKAPVDITVVYTTVSAMPVMSQCVLLAKQYNICVEQTAHAFAITTLCSLAFVPIVVVLLQTIY